MAWQFRALSFNTQFSNSLFLKRLVITSVKPFGNVVQFILKKKKDTFFM